MSNPFHDSGSLVEERTRRRRENVKIGVYAVALTAAVFLAGMLIQGCRADRTANESDSGRAGASDTNPTVSAPIAEEKQSDTNAPVPPTSAMATPPSPAPAPSAPSTAIPPAPNADPPTLSSATQNIYVIKPGDSLSRIAKTHGTTVQALKAANGLKSDRIVAGRKLKLPQSGSASVSPTQS